MQLMRVVFHRKQLQIPDEFPKSVYIRADTSIQLLILSTIDIIIPKTVHIWCHIYRYYWTLIGLIANLFRVPVIKCLSGQQVRNSFLGNKY